MTHTLATLDVDQLARKAEGARCPDDVIERELARLDIYPADRWRVWRKVADRVMGRAKARHQQAEMPGALVIEYRTNEEERTMASTEEVKGFIAALLAEEPEMDYGEINRHVNKRFECAMTRPETSALASWMKRNPPSTNGNGTKPEPPSPSAGDAEPEREPATDPVEGAGETTATVTITDTEEVAAGVFERFVNPKPAPVGDVARGRLRTYARAYIAFNLARDVGPDEALHARGRLYDLEEALIGDLTARADSAEVERIARDLYDRADEMRWRVEELTTALSRAAAG